MHRGIIITEANFWFYEQQFWEKILFLVSLMLPMVTTVIGCDGSSGLGTPGSETSGGTSLPGESAYLDIYDGLSDAGQYYMPWSGRFPEMYWTIPDVATKDNRNSILLSSAGLGLQYHLLSQSLAGIVNRALIEGRTDVGIWLDVEGLAYDKSKSVLGKSLGEISALELCTKDLGMVDGVKVSVRDLIDGYVLSDVVNNPESGNVAAVASHVYNSVIVDIRDKKLFDDVGFVMKYDATKKTTADAWREFRDKCSKNALVVMPVQTGELREYAIANSLFVFNLNRKYGDSGSGQNSSLFDEILAWLEPNAPVLGWEQGVSEDVFVDKVSRYGKLMIPADWSYNHTLTSIDYVQRQKPILAKVVNPKNIRRKNSSLSFCLTGTTTSGS